MIATELEAFRKFDIFTPMTQTSGISKTVGTAGSLLLTVGVLAFFIGIFGPVRNILFIGLALIVLSFAAFFFEEFGSRS